MEILPCPQCGSKTFCLTAIEDKTSDGNKGWTGVCKECGYRSTPTILEKYEGTFQGSQPSSPGFIGLWVLKIRLDNGKEKLLEVLWEDAQTCVQFLQLKRGDRIKVTIGEKLWHVEKLRENEE